MSTNRIVASFLGHIADNTLIQNCVAAGETDSAYFASHDYSEDETFPNIINCYAVSGTLRATAVNEEGWLTAEFIFDTLGWSADIWEITDGGYPALK